MVISNNSLYLNVAKTRLKELKDGRSNHLPVGDKDVIMPEHALELHRMIAHSSLAIIPGVHGEYIGEITTLRNGSKQAEFVAPLIENSLATGMLTCPNP